MENGKRERQRIGKLTVKITFDHQYILLYIFYQDGAKYGGWNALGHFVLSSLIRPREIVLQRRTEHPESKTSNFNVNLNLEDFKSFTREMSAPLWVRRNAELTAPSNSHFRILVFYQCRTPWTEKSVSRLSEITTILAAQSTFTTRCPPPRDSVANKLRFESEGSNVREFIWNIRRQQRLR